MQRFVSGIRELVASENGNDYRVTQSKKNENRRNV